jgi:hypothetical protein
LLLLFLLSALGLAAVLSTSSDLMINGYYSNYRASFYAADSGLNMARESMQNYLTGIVPNGTNWNSNWTQCSGANQPISSLSWTNPYSTSTSVTGASATNPAAVQNSLGESFQVTGTMTFSPCTATTTGPNSPYVTYGFTYTLTSVGTAAGMGQASVTENGTFNLVITDVTTNKPTDTSFSAFGAYIGNFPKCNGAGLAGGTIAGPVFAVGEWNFSTATYTFTNPVDQTDGTFSFYDGSTCYNSATVPYTDPNGTKFNPTFDAGSNLNQTAPPLPANDFSQRWAVLDGLGCGENGGSVCGSIPPTLPNAPTAQQMNQYNLQNAAQNNVAAQPYATVSGSTYTPATSGVFIPYTCSGSTCSLSPTAGGIYVEDSSGAATTLTLTAVTSGTYTGSTFPTSTQCTSAACQLIQVAQAGNSTTGNPVVSQVGSTSCKYKSGNNTTKCTANFEQSTTTTTPTTITNITIDPTSNVTTAQTYVQNSNSTTTSQTQQNECSVSGNGSCTVQAPQSGYQSCDYGQNCTSTSTTNGTATDLTLTGVPTMSTSLATPANTSCTAAASGACAETMIYVDGSVSISGPSSGAAVQNNSMLTVTANGNLTQTGNLLYATEPVTTSGSSLDSLVSLPSNAMYQVLGLYTSVGEFVLAPTGNTLETDASIAMVSSSGSCGSNCGHIESTIPFSTWTVVGGRAENSIHTVDFNTGNTYFDQRFVNKQYPGFAPPWFPQTAVNQGDITAPTAVTSQIYTVKHVQWYSSTGGQ